MVPEEATLTLRGILTVSAGCWLGCPLQELEGVLEAGKHSAPAFHFRPLLGIWKSHFQISQCLGLL